ncbi:MAG TPA: hypothetical protein VGN16_26085 [Acidobacteriaceae bacterium]
MGQQISSALRQSMDRVVIMLARFLPGLLAFFVALAVLWLIGWGLSALLRKLLTSVRFDERVARKEDPGSPANLADWSPSNSPTLLISRTVFWACILAGIAVGISAFNASYSATPEISLFLLPYLTHATGAILLLLIGTLLARFLSRSVLIGAVNAQLHYARFLSLGVKWLVLVLAAAMALDHLQIGGTIVALAFGILFGGIVLTLALAIGLGSRDLVSRSIEKTIEKPTGAKPADVSSINEATETPRPKLRHF